MSCLFITNSSTRLNEVGLLSRCLCVPLVFVRVVSAGYYHSSAITESGELYISGKNSSGQLGLGRKASKVIPIPSKVDFLNSVPINMAALGSDHSLVVTDKGEVLSWGGGESGRLGHRHKSSLLGFLSSASEYTPRLIKELEGVKKSSLLSSSLELEISTTSPQRINENKIALAACVCYIFCYIFLRSYRQVGFQIALAVLLGCDFSPGVRGISPIDVQVRSFRELLGEG
ncbi:hypothetical protein QVD17_12149 [Tagetes erecta]|uniref:Uncharacterized protein n=1 Tax=Tagetes erecta TaxID=13708 RepID=A0AAD8KZ76_TARER|nr:hypothetical protein QVD17_12149 [Tagetes erecta]